MTAMRAEVLERLGGAGRGLGGGVAVGVDLERFISPSMRSTSLMKGWEARAPFSTLVMYWRQTPIMTASFGRVTPRWSRRALTRAARSLEVVRGFGAGAGGVASWTWSRAARAAGGEAGLQGVRREWGVHGEPVAEGFGLEFFHEADEMKGGGLAAVFELTKPKNGNG